MRKLDNQTIIDGLKSNDSGVVNYLYSKHYPIIRRLVRKNSGCDADAMDVFQSSLVIIFNKIRANDLFLFSSFLAYQYAVCQNNWYSELKRRKKFQGYFVDKERLIDLPSKRDVFEKFQMEIKYALFNKYFETLSKLCREVLSLYLQNFSVKQMVAKLKCKDEITVRRRKYDCRMELIKRIRKDPKFHELEQYENN